MYERHADLWRARGFIKNCRNVVVGGSEVEGKGRALRKVILP